MSVETVERFSCVLANNVRIQEDGEASGMETLEPRDIVDICVDDDPQVFIGRKSNKSN